MNSERFPPAVVESQVQRAAVAAFRIHFSLEFANSDTFLTTIEVHSMESRNHSLCQASTFAALETNTFYFNITPSCEPFIETYETSRSFKREKRVVVEIVDFTRNLLKSEVERRRVDQNTVNTILFRVIYRVLKITIRNVRSS